LQKQDLVATSTLEAEYIACLEALREGRWLLQICKDTKQNDDDDENNEPLPIHCDIEGALAHMINGTIKVRMKYIDVCYHNS